MEILGRKVSAYIIEGTGSLEAVVHQKEGDCQKNLNQKYECRDDCGNAFLYAKFKNKEPYSVQCLVPAVLLVHRKLEVKDLPGMDELVKRYRNIRWHYDEANIRKDLIVNNTKVARYSFCHLGYDCKQWTEEGALTAVKLVMRVEELYDVATLTQKSRIDKEGVLSEADRKELEEALQEYGKQDRMISGFSGKKR